MNILGMAAARLIAVLTVPVYILYVEKQTWGKPLYRFWLTICLSLLLAGVAAGFLENYMLAVMKEGWFSISVAVIAGMIAFGSALAVTRYFDRNEREFMRRSIADLVGFRFAMGKRSS
jgi:undecaprenyl pyrophosphate phosphatase UppP